MNSVVIFASRHGNTQRIAEAVAEELRTRGEVRLYEADDAPSTVPTGTDLLVIGGPTEGRSMTEPLLQYFGRLQAGAIDGLAAAAFDTRVTWPRILSGSAASEIAHQLLEKGARLIVPEESFMVSMKPELHRGELERAPEWAAKVAEAVEAEKPVAVR